MITMCEVVDAAGADMLMSAVEQGIGKRMLRRRVDESSQPDCPECNGTGAVTYWNEVAYFEDRRSCKRCGAGQDLDARIAEIVARARMQETLGR
jgi:RecJ-like exonuclease